MRTWVLLLWLPDRPGALGSVAARLGSVGANVVGFDIIGQSAHRALDRFVVELGDDVPLRLLTSELAEVEDIEVEDILAAEDGIHDPRAEALQLAGELVGTDTRRETFDRLGEGIVHMAGADWVIVIDTALGALVSSAGDAPIETMLASLADDTRSLIGVIGPTRIGRVSPANLLVTPMSRHTMTVACGREDRPFTAAERRRVVSLAAIVDRMAILGADAAV